MKQQIIPAFPGYTMEADGDTVTVTKPNPGMSLRDYFAGQALAGMVSGGWMHGSEDQSAMRLYKMADAMLKAREAKL